MGWHIPWLRGIPTEYWAAIQLSTLILLGGLGAMLVWVVDWGAYRELTGMGRFRSLLAFLLFLCDLRSCTS